jgi:hypothetical protein
VRRETSRSFASGWPSALTRNGCVPDSRESTTKDPSASVNSPPSRYGLVSTLAPSTGERSGKARTRPTISMRTSLGVMSVNRPASTRTSRTTAPRCQPSTSTVYVPGSRLRRPRSRARARGAENDSVASETDTHRYRSARAEMRPNTANRPLALVCTGSGGVREGRATVSKRECSRCPSGQAKTWAPRTRRRPCTSPDRNPPGDRPHAEVGGLIQDEITTNDDDTKTRQRVSFVSSCRRRMSCSTSGDSSTKRVATVRIRPDLARLKRARRRSPRRSARERRAYRIELDL